MQTEKITKQGIRDLNSPKNGRKKLDIEEICFHDFQRIKDSSSWLDMSYDGYIPAPYQCVKCGKEQ